MIGRKEATRISKFLSLVLRHQPQLINISLDEKGWAMVPELMEGMKAKGFEITFDILQHIVEINDKKRFAFNEHKTKIRASQGHSINVDLGYQAKEPPALLYHGSAEQNKETILREGLSKRTRQHVHLSATVDTALRVGQRHGKPVAFEIAAGEMHRAGYLFFISENGVWLTDAVPAQYLNQIQG